MWKLICKINFLICSQYWLLGAKPTTTNTTTHTNNRRQVSVNSKQVFTLAYLQHRKVVSLRSSIMKWGMNLVENLSSEIVHSNGGVNFNIFS